MTSQTATDDTKTTTGQGETSPQGGGTGTSQADDKKFTQAELDKAVSDNAATAGRTAKDLGDRETKLKTGEESLATATQKAQEDRDAAEKLAVKDNPDALTALATVQAQRKVREDQEATRLRQEQEDKSLKERETAIAGSTTERLAQAIGAEAKVDSKLLLQYLPNGTEAQMKELAGRLPKVDPTTAGSTSSTPAPDSGITAGTQTDEAKLKDRFPSMH